MNMFIISIKEYFMKKYEDFRNKNTIHSKGELNDKMNQAEE